MISVSVIDRATRLESKMRRIVPTLALVVLLVGSSSFNFVSAADFSNLSLEEQILEIQQKCVFRRFLFENFSANCSISDWRNCFQQETNVWRR